MIRQNFLDKAVTAISGNCIYDARGETIIKWRTPDVPQPSQVDIDTKIAELQAEYDAQAYSRNRQLDYPDWGTQLNKIYDDGLTKWKSEMVDPVKAKWPKDNSGPV